MLLKDARSGDWCFAGGGVKQREQLLDAVQRELFEETHGCNLIVRRLRQLIHERPDMVWVHASTNTNRQHYGNTSDEGRVIELWFTLVFPVAEVDALRMVKHVTLSAHTTPNTAAVEEMHETSSACFVDLHGLSRGQRVYQTLWDVQRGLCEPIQNIIIASTSGLASASPYGCTLQSIKSLDKTPTTFPEWYRQVVHFSYCGAFSDGKGLRPKRKYFSEASSGCPRRVCAW